MGDIRAVLLINDVVSVTLSAGEMRPRGVANTRKKTHTHDVKMPVAAITWVQRLLELSFGKRSVSTIRMLCEKGARLRRPFPARRPHVYETNTLVRIVF